MRMSPEKRILIDFPAPTGGKTLPRAFYICKISYSPYIGMRLLAVCLCMFSHYVQKHVNLWNNFVQKCEEKKIAICPSA